MILWRSINSTLISLWILLIGLGSILSNPDSGGGEPRGFAQNVDTKINILAKLGERYLFPAVMLSGESPTFWILSRFVANLNKIDASTLYHYRIKPRNQSLMNEYACVPSEDNCGQLYIANIAVQNLGFYSFRVETSDLLVTKNFLYNVSAYDPIQLECLSQNGRSCIFDQSTQTLSVAVDQPATIQCSVPIVQNDNHPISAQVNFYSEFNGEECRDTSSTIEPFSYDKFNSLNNGYKLITKRIVKSCTHVFRREESTRSYTCQMNPTPASGVESPLYQWNNTYQSLAVKIDLHFGPDPTQPLDNLPGYLVNKTFITGSSPQASFSCPFVGNPSPNYFWRVVSVQIENNTSLLSSKRRVLTPTNESFLSSQDYSIPRDIELGHYVFECKAQVLGLMNQFSQPVLFYLRVDRNYNLSLYFFFQLKC